MSIGYFYHDYLYRLVYTNNIDSRYNDLEYFVWVLANVKSVKAQWSRLISRRRYQSRLNSSLLKILAGWTASLSAQSMPFRWTLRIGPTPILANNHWKVWARQQAETGSSVMSLSCSTPLRSKENQQWSARVIAIKLSNTTRQRRIRSLLWTYRRGRESFYWRSWLVWIGGKSISTSDRKLWIWVRWRGTWECMRSFIENSALL